MKRKLKLTPLVLLEVALCLTLLAALATFPASDPAWWRYLTSLAQRWNPLR